MSTLISSYLSPELVKDYQKSTLSNTESAFAISVCRLYTCKSSIMKWDYSGLFGVLMLVYNRNAPGWYFQLHSYPLPSTSLLFECEIPYNMPCTIQTDHFCAYQINEFMQIGFLFPNQNPSDPESVKFVKKCQSVLAKQHVDNSIPADIAGAASRGRNKSITQKIFGLFSSVSGTQAPTATMEIGVATDVKHLMHFGHDGTFESPDGVVSANDPIVAQFLQATCKTLGLTKKEMENPEIREIVEQTLKEKGLPSKKEMAEAIMKSAPSSSTSATTNTVAKKPTFLTVKAKFMKGDTGQLTVKVGERVRLVKKYDDGWVKVERSLPDGTKERGLIPFDYTEEEGKAAPASRRDSMSKRESSASASPSAKSTGSQKKSSSSPKRVVQQQQQQQEEETQTTSTNVAPEPTPAVQPPSAPPLPSMNNALLAGIKGFNKEQALAKVPDTPSPAAAPKNDMLSAIANFKKDALKKVETPTEAPAPEVNEESNSLASVLQARLANVRMNIKADSDEEDNSDDADWD